MAYITDNNGIMIEGRQPLAVRDVGISSRLAEVAGETVTFKTGAAGFRFCTCTTFGVNAAGASSFDYPFNSPFRFEGPAIVKLQVTASTADIDVSAVFDGYLVYN